MLMIKFIKALNKTLLDDEYGKIKFLLFYGIVIALSSIILGIMFQLLQYKILEIICYCGLILGVMIEFLALIIATKNDIINFLKKVINNMK